MARRAWYCEDILSGQVEVRVVWEDDRVLAFHHPQPKAEIHVVVIPKDHVPSILDPMALDGALLTSMVLAVQETAKELGLCRTGFYVRTNAAAPGVTPHMQLARGRPGNPVERLAGPALARRHPAQVGVDNHGLVNRRGV